MEVGETEMVQSLLEGKAQFLGQQKPKRGSGEVGRKQIEDKFQHDSTYFWSMLYANMQCKCDGFVKFPESMRSIDTPDRLGWTDGMVKDLQVWHGLSLSLAF